MIRKMALMLMSLQACDWTGCTSESSTVWRWEGGCSCGDSLAAILPKVGQGTQSEWQQFWESRCLPRAKLHSHLNRLYKSAVFEWSVFSPTLLLLFPFTSYQPLRSYVLCRMPMRWLGRLLICNSGCLQCIKSCQYHQPLLVGSDWIWVTGIGLILWQPSKSVQPKPGEGIGAAKPAFLQAAAKASAGIAGGVDNTLLYSHALLVSSWIQFAHLWFSNTSNNEKVTSRIF